MNTNAPDLTTEGDEEEDEKAGKPVRISIRAIDRGVVHQICSGQVIVTLSTAVKELVENSLDAGATKIDIRLVDHGSKLIEVSDDGSGIAETNFEGLALKHCTSKISEFEDLGSLSTFGFRGEALSSLCAMSSLRVMTRSRDSNQKVGWSIDYDNFGRILAKSRCAREFGTTIILKDLFHTLPVRHREFLKNLKKEFHRLMNVLHGYCLVVKGVRISCTNQIGSGAPTKLICVPPYESIKERIVAVFGSKQISSLIEIKQCDSVPEDILTEYGLTGASQDRKYELEGYISKPNHGRSCNDRQFFFINRRPCDPTKISRLVNEIYRSFSRQSNPFVCLHIITGREDVDVNVTPDKRTLYVHNEKVLLACLKATLTPLFTEAVSTFTSNPTQTLDAFTQRENAFEENYDSVLESSSLCSPSLTFNHEFVGERLESQSSPSPIGFDRQYSSSSVRSTSRSVVRERTNAFIKKFQPGSNIDVGFRKTSNFSSSSKRLRSKEDSPIKDSSKHAKLSQYRIQSRCAMQSNSGNVKEPSDMDVVEASDSDSGDESQLLFSNRNTICNEESDESDGTEVKIVYDDELENESEIEEFHRGCKSVTIKVDWKQVLLKQTSKNQNVNTLNYARRFRAKISPEENCSAEEELKTQLTKETFCEMKVIGQFNLGFIIVRNGPDLFIVDQHASDEKFNYEDLEKTTVLQGQQLIHPMDLQLPAISENVIIDNIENFQRNGFDFIICPNDEPTKRVKLSKIPYSKSTEFGKSDIEELIFMMEDESDKSFYRPTKVRQMLASRACRKSVMIGTPLSPREMSLIVNHMGEMEQPWNCPHGRPTIRHLINLNLLPDLNLYKFNH